MTGDDYGTFEWDENKRQATIEKHGIDFAAAIRIFRDRYLELPGRSGTEERRIAIGSVDGKVIAVVFTRRGEAIRIVTARVARRHEREDFWTLYDG